MEIFRPSCWRVSLGFWEILHETLWFTPRKPVITKVWKRCYWYQYRVTWNSKSPFDMHYAKPGEGTDGSKNDSGNVDYSAISEREIKSLQ